jgi:hypothetical protein
VDLAVDCYSLASVLLNNIDLNASFARFFLPFSNNSKTSFSFSSWTSQSWHWVVKGMRGSSASDHRMWVGNFDEETQVWEVDPWLWLWIWFEWVY